MVVSIVMSSKPKMLIGLNQKVPRLDIGLNASDTQTKKISGVETNPNPRICLTAGTWKSHILPLTKGKLIVRKAYGYVGVGG
jgi:hypothetical protein